MSEQIDRSRRNVLGSLALGAVAAHFGAITSANVLPSGPVLLGPDARAAPVLALKAQGELYAEPRTRFVAEFIGDSDFLKGRVVWVRDGRPTFASRTASWFPPCPPTAARPDSDAALMLRPSASRSLAPKGREGWRRSSGT